MNNQELNAFLITNDTSVRKAMKQLESSHRKVLFVVDKEEHLFGSLTDGDLRRWILSDGELDSDVIHVCNKNTFTVNEKFNNEDIKKIILKEKYSAIPVINKNKRIIDILFWDEIFQNPKPIKENKKIDVPVMIMAGGEGKRLEPFTKILPKPLIPIGDKTIIEIIIDKFLEYNVNHFYISVNHKSKIITSFFEELSPLYEIEYVHEKIPLGTIGSLAYLKGKLNSPIIVTNCDIIIDANYSDFLEFHQTNKYDISLVASLMHQKIPYGICETESGTLSNFKEKPEFTFLASTGMYIINPEIIELIPDQTFFHITELIDILRKKGGKVGVFPINEDSWLDTGEWHEYKKTLEKFKL